MHAGGYSAAMQLALAEDRSAVSDAEEPPVAEHNFMRKKLLGLEQGVGKLQRTARQQHEVVTQIEGEMKTMISETDLRRAIGLAFQEFEDRLEDCFQDSNRKYLAMFSKRDEVSELQSMMSKKINWAQFNVMTQKMAELRQYIDTMAESLMTTHRDNTTKQQDDNSAILRGKADVEDLNEVRARLERLEVLVAHMDTKHSAKLEELREELQEKSAAEFAKNMSLITANQSAVSSLRADHTACMARVSASEAQLSTMDATMEQLRTSQEVLQSNTQGILSTIGSMQQQLATMGDAAGRAQRDLQALAGDLREFREVSQKKIGDLSAQGNTCKDKIEFLMEATEMTKRRSRETNKSNAASFKEVGEEQEKSLQRLAALERQLKRQEREVRAVERCANRALDENAPSLGGALRVQALTGAHSEDSGLLDLGDSGGDAPNSRLQGVLQQLEKIAAGGSHFEQMRVEVNPLRPPLPSPGDKKWASELDLSTMLPRFDNSIGPAPIDTARAQATVKGMYGLSPRTAGGGVKAARKKNR